MSDIQKQLRHIALRKRDEKGEDGIRVSEKSFVEWQAADEIERLQKKCDYKDEVIEQRDAECSRQFKEIDRLRAVLKRIDVETSDEYAREIAREALEQ